MSHIVHQLYPLPADVDPLNGPIARRHLIYFQGFFTQGPAYYYGLLTKQLFYHARLYGLEAKISPLEKKSPLVSRCEIETKKDGSAVRITYDFLDWEDIIHKAHNRSLFYTITRAIRTVVRQVFDGTFFRLLGVFWKFGLAWALPYVLFSLIGFFALIGLRNGYEIFSGAEILRPLVTIFISAAMIFIFCWLARIYWSATLIRDFNYAFDYARGRTPELEKKISDFAGVMTQTCKNSDADEILIVGHSFGSHLAVRAAIQAWHKGAFAGNKGRIKLLTMGDANCHIGLMRGEGAAQVRKAAFDLGRQNDLPWQLIYSGKDALSFDNADPPSTLRQSEGDAQSRAEDFNWPLMADAHLRSMMEEKDYYRLRWRFFHLHGVFIMAARLKTARFDYLRAVCGAVPLALSGKRISAKTSA